MMDLKSSLINGTSRIIYSTSKDVFVFLLIYLTEKYWKRKMKLN